MKEATDDRVTLLVNGIYLRFAPKGRWVELIQRAKMAQVTNDDGLRVPDGAFQAAAQQAAAIFAQRRRQAAKKAAGDAQLFPFRGAH